MWKLEEIRKGVAWFTAVFFCTTVIGTLFIACPFLKAEVEMAKMPCCPRSSVPAKHCPLSNSIQTCPFYITEGKIGIAEGKFQLGYLPFSHLPFSELHPVGDIQVATDEAFVSTASYIVNRVLRI